MSVFRSDGHQPHHVDIKFQKKTEIVELHVYVDFSADESYTPNKICIRAGSSHFDLKEITTEEFIEPRGWQKISLIPTEDEEVFRAKHLQLSVVSNHQNGRDTHIRQIKVFGPKLQLSDDLAESFIYCLTLNMKKKHQTKQEKKAS